MESLTHTEIEQIAPVLAGHVADLIMARIAPGRWLTLNEAMAYAKIKSRRRIMEMINRGDIYAYRGDTETERGGNWLVDRITIDKLYESGK